MVTDERCDLSPRAKAWYDGAKARLELDLEYLECLSEEEIICRLEKENRMRHMLEIERDERLRNERMKRERMERERAERQRFEKEKAMK
jgi:hypothetical protein